MIRRGLLSALVLAGCTGQNVDENFVSTHGALLARVECRGLMASGPNVLYSALMFLDGSVLASGAANNRSGLGFYERSDAGRVNAVATTFVEDACGAPGEEYFAIESGTLNFYICQGVPAAHVLDGTLDIDTDCTGFNKSLFD